MDAFGEGPAYTDANRAFLQAILARSTLTLDTAKPVIAICSTFSERREVQPEDVTAEDLNDYVSDANRRLRPLDLEIRHQYHQQTRERIYALVNTTSDPLTQLATTYSADEIAFVKNLLDAMFDSTNNRARTEAMCISGIDAIQVGDVRARNRRRTYGDGDEAQQQSTAGQLGARDVEALLKKLVDEGWLEKSRAGFYSLSPRALMELKGWLIDTYNDEDGDGTTKEKIKMCYACKEIITVVSTTA
jgi:non-structural maintenance of chromosomes element 1